MLCSLPPINDYGRRINATGPSRRPVPFFRALNYSLQAKMDGAGVKFFLLWFADDKRARVMLGGRGPRS